MTISERLKTARASLGLSQKDFAAQSGVSARGYQGYEDGRSVPGGEAIAGFVRLGINANWLLTGEGPMLLADLAPRPAPPAEIDEGALSAIIYGLATAGVPPDKLGRAALRAYQDVYGRDLVIHPGIGAGGSENR